MNGSFVVSILTGITAVMAVALVVANLLRRRRAATRHAVLTAAFAIALVLPAASAIAPYVAIRVPVPAPAVLANAMASFDEIRAPMPTDVVTSSVGQAQAVQRPVTVSLATVVTMIWLLGFVVCLAPVAIGLLEMRSLGGRGLPWAHGRALTDDLALSLGLRRRVGIVLHESVSGPMTYGTSRPTIVMPFDAESWTDEQLTRAIVHELEHIRRADWLTQCLARTPCAAYWFHPLVWIARRQLVLEAERASDDGVLRYAEAAAYADQLVDLARRLSAGHRPLLAMANRRDLAARVRALLDVRQPRGRAGAWLIAVVSCIAAALVLVMSPMRVVAGSQEPQASANRPHFDVVSVKRCDPKAPPAGGGRSMAGQTSPTHFQLNCYAVDVLIFNAYVSFANGRSSRSSEQPYFDLFNVGPDWIHTERYTIEGTIAAPTPQAVMQGPMLQLVLEDRFKVKMHRETRDVPVDELVIAKGGPKQIAPFKPGTCVPWDFSVYPPPPLEAGQRRCSAGQHDNGDGRYFQNVEAMTLDDWVAIFGSPTGARRERPIVNKTGITGLKTFRWISPRTPDDLGDELKNQLGLELRPGRASREFLILDHVERPVPDGESLAAPTRAMGAGR